MKKKIIAAILTLIMTWTHLLTIGNAVIAISDELNMQNSKTNHANVELDSYFEGGVYNKKFEIGEKANIYFMLKVKNTGYLKNTSIKLADSNYEFDINNTKNENIQSITANEIKVKQIDSHSGDVIIEVPIYMLNGEQVASDLLSKISKVQFTATYIDGDGKQREIKKEIKNQIIWNKEAEVELAGTVNKYQTYQVGEEKGVLVQAKVRSSIKENSLPVEKTKLEISVPEIKIPMKQDNQEEANVEPEKTQMIKPARITVVANTTKATNGKENLEFTKENYNYNEETNTLEIEVINQEENGKISWNKNAVDEYLVSYVFTGEEVYNYIEKQLERAKETIKTEEEKEQGKTNENAITGELKVKAEIKVYGQEQSLEKEGKISYSVEEKIGNIVDFDMYSTKEVSKGYIYANYAKTAQARKAEGKETTYETIYNAQIYDTNITKNVEFRIDNEKLLNSETNEEVNVQNNIITKQISISEKVFNKILGEEGKIEVLSTKGDLIAEITNTFEKDNNGNYVLDLSEKELNEITIKTSAPIAEGRIEINVQKAFIKEQAYTKEEMKKFQKMIIGVNAKSNTNTKNLQEEISLKEPVSKAEISIEEGKENLSAVVKNKNVDIRVVLDTSSIENALYKNPVIEIQIPKEIQKVDIKSSNLLLDDELRIKNTQVVSQNGKQIIKIILEGTQTKYYAQDSQNVISKGATIVLNTDITVNPLSPGKDAEIVMYYINENTNLYEKEYQPRQKVKARTVANQEKSQAIGMATDGITIVTETGVIAANGISNYAEGKDEVLTTSDNIKKVEITPYSDKRVATITGTIVNNTGNKITNVKVLGRFFTKDNKKIDSEEALGSTFDAKLSGDITLTGTDTANYTVYYSAKVDANTNLEDSNNGWTEAAFKDAKSYMIKFSENYQFSENQLIDFRYNVEIPENLAYNHNSYEMYKIYYNNLVSTGAVAETKNSPVIGMTTGVGPEIEISVKSANSTVREGQIVRMTATIKNVGQMKVENAKLLITAPEGTVHTEIENGMTNYSDSESKEKIINIGNIGPGDLITKEYELRIIKSEENEEEGEEQTENSRPESISNIVRISGSNIQSEIKSDPYIMNILEGHLEIINTPIIYKSGILKKGESIKYKVEVTNISNNKQLENVNLNIKLPNGIKANDIYYIRDNDMETKVKNNINISGNDININVGKLESSNAYIKEIIDNNPISAPEDINKRLELIKEKTKNICTRAYVYIEFVVEDFRGEYEYMVSATANNMDTHYSNVQKIRAEKIELKLLQKELENQYIDEGTEYTYNFSISNIGKSASTANKFEMNLPEELSFIKAEYLANGKKETIKTNNSKKILIEIYNIEAGKSVEITITVRANWLKDKTSKEIINMATLEAQGFEKIESNKVKAIIEYDESAHQIESDDEKNQHYKITGTAWIDVNKDGKRDENEALLQGIQVLLLYKSNSQLVTDKDNGAQKITTTDENGKYEFNNLKSEEYIVLFLYDAAKYSITDYQKQGVSENYNSDATSMKIILNGEQRYAGVTNTIKVLNKNVRDIDIGLYVAEKFDLRLDKYISKISITTPSSGTRVYNYNDAKITKQEVYGKDVNNSTLVVEYKIVVTNEGQIDGYAKKIIDYLPEDAKFNTELNRDWYISENNGAVYNNSLANEKILPGQSKEVRLVLSFGITDKNIGTIINNNAEIYESYNEQALEDIDSIAANRLETEDDMSNADIMLSIATGKIILYITLSLATIVLIGFGVFEIKRRILTKRI